MEFILILHLRPGLPKYSGPKKTFNWLEDLDSIVAESEDKPPEEPIICEFVSFLR